ncbi:HAD family hydrolase [Paracoccaceae bacterium Fryx2]|nr:HAD family hydrolase [Paracoccaceae bacterium Fryx2]
MKLLVLDLDETLVHATEVPLSREPDFSLYGYCVYRRPCLDQFLQFCDAHFAVGVWSSAGDDYVQAMVREIFPNPAGLIMVWGASRTTMRRTHPGDHDGFGRPLPDFHHQKRLRKLTRFGWSIDDMLVVDDSPEKCRANFGNAIYPAPFFGDTNDDELKYLAGYLLSLRDRDRIRKIEKRGWRSSTFPMPW